jgi:hypothetical protein
MYTIQQVVGEDILLRYQKIKIELEKALDYSSGEWTAAQIVESAIREPVMFHIWEVLKDNLPVATGATRVIQYNNFTSLHIMTLSGSDIGEDLSHIIGLFEEIIRKYDGIDILEYTGRRGFVKHLTKVGWKERYTTMRKSLKEGLDV